MPTAAVAYLLRLFGGGHLLIAWILLSLVATLALGTSIVRLARLCAAELGRRQDDVSAGIAAG
jgi:hypothetical protein